MAFVHSWPSVPTSLTMKSWDFAELLAWRMSTGALYLPLETAWMYSGPHCSLKMLVHSGWHATVACGFTPCTAAVAGATETARAPATATGATTARRAALNLGNLTADLAFVS